MTKERFTSPVGRLVQGSVDEAQTKDMQGRPRTVKSGPNAGQPNPQFYIGVAIAKNDPAWPEFHAAIYRKAAADFPALFPNAAAGDLTCIRPDFAFKIVDGDSPMLNQAGRAWNSYEGLPGHWLVRFASAYPPRCFHAGRYAPNEQIQEKNVIRRGYYIRVSGSMEGNGDQTKPGLYLNLDMVELSAYGQEIVSGPDAGAAFAGGPTALPSGATAAPQTTGAPPPPGAAGAPAPYTPPPVGNAPPVPGAAPSPAAGSPVPGNPPPSPAAGPQRPTDPTHIHAAGTPDEQWYVNGAWMKAPAAPPPYTGYMAPGGNAASTAAPPSHPPAAPSAPVATASPTSAPPVPPTAPPAPVRTMLPAAQGATYEALIAAGWNDDLLRQHGMMA